MGGVYDEVSTLCGYGLVYACLMCDSGVSEGGTKVTSMLLVSIGS